MNNIETGKIGENMACNYLINNNYSILTRNHKERFDEIDIIARRKDGVLIFIEIKTTNNIEEFLNGFMPEDNFSPAKHRRVKRAVESFLVRNTRLIRENEGWQIDLIAIVLKNGELDELRHYKNI